MPTEPVSTLPVLEALCFALDHRPAAEDDSTPLGSHEGLAMLTLLGRRAGVLGITPTAALSIAPALADALSVAEHKVTEGVRGTLQMVSMEGYVAGREERLLREGAERAAGALTWTTLAPRCLALWLAGEHEPEALRSVADDFGRELLRQDAASCLVDVTRLSEPTLERAREVMGVAHTARTLGVACFLVGASAAWQRLLFSDAFEAAPVQRFDTTEAALPDALAAAGVVMKPAKGWFSLKPGRSRRGDRH